MEFNELKKLILANTERYSKQHNIEIDLYWLILKLMEESGEFANALLIHEKKCRASKIKSDEEDLDNLKKEISDVFTMVVLIAEKLNIDLIETLEEKVLKKGREYIENNK